MLSEDGLDVIFDTPAMLVAVQQLHATSTQLFAEELVQYHLTLLRSEAATHPERPIWSVFDLPEPLQINFARSVVVLVQEAPALITQMARPLPHDFSPKTLVDGMGRLEGAVSLKFLSDYLNLLMAELRRQQQQQP